MVEIPSQMVEACRRGDEQAFEALVRMTERQIYSLVFRMVGNRDDASDVVQEAYLKAWRGIKEFRGDSAITSWLYRVASNAAVEFLRKRSRLAEPIEPDRMTEMITAPEQRVTVEGSDAEAALARLPAAYRAVLVMRELYGMSIEEIAQQMKATNGATKVRLHRARLRLAHEIAQSGDVIPLHREKKTS